MTHYTTVNYGSKKAIKDAIKEGVEVNVVKVGIFGNEPVTNGTVAVSGPHYPQPHKFYGTAVVKDGKVIKFS